MDPSACRTLLVTAHCPPPMRKRETWRVDQFHLLRKIGSGYASTVYYATCRTTGNQVAVKLYHKSKLSELNHFQVAREIKIHGSLDHKHIIQLWAAFEDQYGIYLVFEYASKGDVFTEVERRGGQLSEAETVRQVIYPFLMSLDYLHSNHIIHRDIKPENLLFTATGVLKVGDFGLSINSAQERPVTRVGTLDYMAPEVVVCPDKHRPQDHKELKHLHYTALVDAWAVGVLAYELIIGRPPFDKGHKKATIQEIINGEPFVPPWVSEGATHFIKWALTKDQIKRPSVQQLVEHPWIMSHTKAAMPTARRAIAKNDSFVESRQLGFRDTNMAGPGGGQGIAAGKADAAPRPQQITAVVQGGRFLGHSNSMSALDGMRFRDIHLDSLTGGGGMAVTAQEAISSVKRVSDGDGTTGGRPSAAGGRVSRAGMGSTRNSSAGNAISRMNSIGSHSSPPAAEESPRTSGRMTREEILASLQVPMQRSPTLNRSFSTQSRPPQLNLHTNSNGVRSSGGATPSGHLRSGSFVAGAGSPGRPSPLQRSIGGSGNQSHDVPHAPSAIESLQMDLARLQTSSSGNHCGHESASSASSSQPSSPKGGNGLRPQPPQAPPPGSPGSAGSRGFKGSPLIPSRLSQSFSSTTSPLATAASAPAHSIPHPHSSRLGTPGLPPVSPSGQDQSHSRNASPSCRTGRSTTSPNVNLQVEASALGFHDTNGSEEEAWRAHVPGTRGPGAGTSTRA